MLYIYAVYNLYTYIYMYAVCTYSPTDIETRLDACEQLLRRGVHLREGGRGPVDGVEPRHRHV